MKLSILIPTLPNRIIMFANMFDNLSKQAEQFPGEVEILSDDRGREITTGEKRNALLERSQGEYTVFVDDDDEVPPHYIEEIMKGIETSPDCIGITGMMTTNGAYHMIFKHYLGADYVLRDGYYHRFNNHINPIKAIYSKQIKFEHITVGEDYKWGCKLRDSGLLKKEYTIDKIMYYYKFIPNK